MNRLLGIIVCIVLVIVLISCNVESEASKSTSRGEKVPIIVVTDTYHPYQDPGDNFDLIMGYALPRIDLKAIILDITNAFRKPVADHPTLWNDPRGPREAGIIPVMQLNYIFNKNIPFAVGPMSAMKSPKDKMLDVPGFQQDGVKLLLHTLRESRQKVSILSFGSARVVAVAFNREPVLFRKKVKTIHLSVGTASPNFELGKDQGANAIPGGEWNVALDVHAFIRLLRSDLPIAIYPCAGKDGAFVLDQHNTYWQMPNLQFIRQMDKKLQHYLNYAFEKVLRHDFLRAMDVGEVDDSVSIANNYPSPHHIWETPLWIQVSGRKLIQREGDYLIIPGDGLRAGDRVLSGDLKYCRLPEVRDDGRFSFEVINKESNFMIYERENPVLSQKALQEALPKLYTAFRAGYAY